MKSSSSGGSKFDFVRRVLSRTSSRNRSRSESKLKSKSSNNTNPSTSPGMDNQKTTTPRSSRSSAKFQSELLLLKSQLESLQISVHQIQADNAVKDRALADATKEKEQLTVDLKKQRRSNANLRQQLEDERSFYYKEKEQYCQEMHSVKKQKHIADATATPLSAQKDIAELRNNLNQTLEANYNLSVKFLRMKNTKLGLKKQITTINKQHEDSTKYYKSKVEEMKRHMDTLVLEQLHKPIPPSSKKYLHLLKNNGSLMHENLQLQMEIDKLHGVIEGLKLTTIKNETNNKLKLIRHDSNTKVKTICANCKLKSSARSTTTRSVKSQTPITSSRSRNSHCRSKNHNHNNCTKSTTTLNTSDLSVEVVKIEKQGKLTASTVVDSGATSQEKPNFKQINEQLQLIQSQFDLMTISNSDIDKNKNTKPEQVSNSSLDTNESKVSLEIKSAPEILLQASKHNLLM